MTIKSYLIKTIKNPLLYISIVCIMVVSCSSHKSYTIAFKDSTSITIDSLYTEKDTSALLIIQPFKENLEKQMTKIIGYSEQAMIKETPEGLLNNLMADIIFIETNNYLDTAMGIRADICLLNMGGIRSDLPQGPIQVSHIYEIMPFENSIVVLRLSKESMQELLNYVADKEGMPISGFKMGILKGKPQHVIFSNNSWPHKSNYMVVTSNYLAEGGDNMHFFSHALETIETNYLIREALINYIRKEHSQNKNINSKLDKRLYVE